MSTYDSRATQVEISIGPFVQGFCQELRATGYAPLTIRGLVRGVHHLGAWADSAGISGVDFDERVIAQFFEHLAQCRCNWRSKGKFRPARAAAKLFLAHLRRVGVVRTPVERPGRATSKLIAQFEEWMRMHRGLSAATLGGYERALEKFVDSAGDDPSRFTMAQVRGYVLQCMRRQSRARAKWTVNAIRALLRFLAAEGRVSPALPAAVLTVPQWRLSSLPRYLEPEVVERVIASCDVSSVHGLRDRAILLLLARLGLRAGDIVSMRLDDIDWARGTLRVCGKGRREAVLPLPQPVGLALLEYLERGRPKVALDHVFLCAQAPYRPFASSASVSDVVRLALARARIRDAPSRGANLMRHSAATAMLRGGATLEAIAAILRHRSPDTTLHYAKIDLGLLLQVAQPWPEGAPC